MGQFFSEWVPWIGGKQRGLNLYTCWYDNWKDMVVASNSLWLHRQNWSLHTNRHWIIKVGMNVRQLPIYET